MKPPQPQPMQFNVDLSKAQQVECDQCQGIEFKTGHELRILSPLQSPTGKQQLVRMEFEKCAACGLRVEQKAKTPN